MTQIKKKIDLEKIICGRVGPQIYAFTIEEAKGYTKIGDTYRPLNLRLNEWQKIYDTKIEPVYRKPAIIDGHVYYRDISIHKYLRANGKHILSKADSNKIGLKHYSKEFFNNIITPDDIESARKDIEEKYRMGDNINYDYYNLIDSNTAREKDTFKAREDQKEVIKAFNEAIRNGEKKMLMYAVMRFGKSFTAMSCANEIKKCKFVLIVSSKKDVINEWKNTVENHVDFCMYRFLTVDDLLDDYTIVNSLLKQKKKVVVCTTLQDLQCKKVKERYKQLFKNKIDLMIIDEAHYGAGANIQGEIIKKANLISKEEEDNENIGVSIEKIEKLLSEKKLNVKYQLFLSGTPYSILAQKDFTKKQIICSIRYADIIRKKNELALSLSLDDNKQEWDNEYYDFPEMIRFGFNISNKDKKMIDSLKEYNWSGDLSELFKIKESTKKNKHPKFIHRKDVLNLLKAIDGAKQYENVLGFLNIDAVKKDRICRHIVICLNQKDMCNALEDLLLEESDNFINLKTKGTKPNYRIINISGDRERYRIDNIRQTISNYEEKNQKTISLTVRRMMTGVTVKEWDTMLMFKSTKSSEEYDQAIFRLQSGFSKKIYKTKDKNDYIIENLKPQTIVVDFDLNRMYSIQEKSSSLNGYRTSQNNCESTQEKIQNDLQYAPIITMNKNELKSVEAIDIIKAITNYTQNKSIIDEVSGINYKEIDINSNDKLLQLILKQNELTTSKSEFEIKAFIGEDSKLDKEKLKKYIGELKKKAKDRKPFTKEEKKLADALENKKKMLIAKILFFSFLSPDDIKYYKDIIDKIDSSETNKRIAKNLGLTKKDISVLFKCFSDITLNKLNTKISKANILSSDDEIEGVDKNLAALAEFNRFSDSEVITPNSTCEKVIKLLSKDRVIKNINNGYKILDYASKQGEFAYAIYNWLKDDFRGNESKLQDAIYSIPTSSISYEFTKKMYESLGLNINNIAENFNSYDLLEQDQDHIVSLLTQKKNFSKIDLRERIKKGELNMLKFAVVVGNPPYQLKGGSGGNNDAPIYQDFVTLANKLSDDMYSLIIKASWFSSGRKSLIDPFRRFMMNDKSIKNMNVSTDASKIFGNNVDIKGGVCYFLHDNKYSGKCNYIIDDKRAVKRDLNSLEKYNVIIRDTTLSNIVLKIISTFNVNTKTVDKIISNDTPFGIPSNPGTSKKTPFKVYDKANAQHDIVLFHIDHNQRVKSWVSRKDIKKNETDVNKDKVFIPGAYGAGETFPHQIIGISELAQKNSVCSQSYIYAAFNNKDEAKCFQRYLETRFLRALVASIKITQTSMSDVYRFVPVLDFSKSSSIFYNKNGKMRSVDEIDEILYKKYKISAMEIKYIKDNIKKI